MESTNTDGCVRDTGPEIVDELELFPIGPGPIPIGPQAANARRGQDGYTRDDEPSPASPSRLRRHIGYGLD
jgi:hypothetical protein